MNQRVARSFMEQIQGPDKVTSWFHSRLERVRDLGSTTQEDSILLTSAEITDVVVVPMSIITEEIETKDKFGNATKRFGVKLRNQGT